MINLLPPAPPTDTTVASSDLRATLFDWVHDLPVATRVRRDMLLFISRATVHSTTIVTTGELAETWQVAPRTAWERLKRMSRWCGPDRQRLFELRTHPEDRDDRVDRSEARRRILMLHHPGGPWDQARELRELEYGVLNAMRGPLAEDRQRRAAQAAKAWERLGRRLAADS